MMGTGHRNANLIHDLLIHVLPLSIRVCNNAPFYIPTSAKILLNNNLSHLSDIDIKSGLVLPIVKCLRHLVHHNPATRETLAANTEIYASLLRIIG